ncbi:MAG: polyprenyl synthetase family protein [Planctomycetaceae bacterium]|jgi:octaprenyl-diphosphate synthase|nr:polyprenyl synthetase family protein [Planctomycetaceae bacterium]
MQDVKDVYCLISEDLVAMEGMASQLISDVGPFVDEVVRYGLQLGGKRLRPVLLFLTARGVGKVTESHIRAATAIELIHTATLIHDDILDGALIRRHLTTINFKWNPHVAVLAGDILLTKAMELLTCSEDIHGFRRVAVACRQTCEGELLQTGTIGGFKISQNDYMNIIARKTAPFLACSTELGAYYSGAEPATIELFRHFGQQLGIAFQMIDDVLDLAGKTDTTGKTLRTDILNRKPTLPLILYLQKASKSDIDEVMLRLNDVDGGKSNISETDAEWIAECICNSGVVNDIKQLAETIIDAAIESIANYPSGNSSAITGLAAIAKFITLRKN